jgi:hypothetical protein
MIHNSTENSCLRFNVTASLTYRLFAIRRVNVMRTMPLALTNHGSAAAATPGRMESLLTTAKLVLALSVVATVIVGTLKDGYVRNVPLPRVPQIQSAKLLAPSRCIPEGNTPSRCIPLGTPLPDYLRVSSWIPTLPKIDSLLRFSQRVL